MRTRADRRTLANSSKARRTTGVRAKLARVAGHGERPARSRGAEMQKRSRHENRHQELDFGDFVHVSDLEFRYQDDYD